MQLHGPDSVSLAGQSSVPLHGPGYAVPQYGCVQLPSSRLMLLPGSGGAPVVQICIPLALAKFWRCHLNVGLYCCPLVWISGQSVVPRLWQYRIKGAHFQAPTGLPVGRMERVHQLARGPLFDTPAVNYHRDLDFSSNDTVGRGRVHLA